MFPVFVGYGTRDRWEWGGLGGGEANARLFEVNRLKKTLLLSCIFVASFFFSVGKTMRLF